jgi:hypothetical protein
MREFMILAIILAVLSIPLIAIITEHYRKMVEMKMRMGEPVDRNVLQALGEVKEQLAELRDTTTRYDLSFDTALQRLEGRMNSLEQRVHQIEQERRAIRTEHR